MAALSLRCGERELDLSSPAVMGILNVTPDSFSDGGRLSTPDRAVDEAAQMCDDGALILDVGGESTRPGASDVPLSAELERVIPVIERLVARFDVVVSVDTSKADVMVEAVRAGATLINDVRALREPDALAAAAAGSAAVCLMHMLGEPRTMQDAPYYGDLIGEINTFLRERVDACTSAGIAPERICVDPGYGFGKTLEHNLQLVAKLDEISPSNLPLVFGASRKSSIGHLLGAPVEDRLHGSVAMALLAVERGAAIVRVHDVKPTWQAIQIAVAVRNASKRADSLPG